MVNYACIGRSQRKLWWRLVAILTCKSFVKYGYRGERLIEPSSSWFPPKFPPVIETSKVRLPLVRAERLASCAYMLRSDTVELREPPESPHYQAHR